MKIIHPARRRYQMGLLFELEEKFEGTVLEQPGHYLQDALNHYRAMCKVCDLTMHCHHTYARGT